MHDQELFDTPSFAWIGTVAFIVVIATAFGAGWYFGRSNGFVQGYARGFAEGVAIKGGKST